MPVKEIVSGIKEKMKKAAEFFHDELRAVRTGRASTGLVENVKVDYYGTATPLKQLATMAAPEADLIVIKPFDPGSVREIAKAIKNSDLSLAPIVDGKVIRLNIPPLSEERREQLVHQAKQMGEQTKVSIRNMRRDANKQLEREEKEKVVTEDDLHQGREEIDDVTKEYTDKIDEMVRAKSDEIMLE